MHDIVSGPRPPIPALTRMLYLSHVSFLLSVRVSNGTRTQYDYWGFDLGDITVQKLGTACLLHFDSVDLQIQKTTFFV